MEFRHLQLDDTLRTNSLFDMIDHCEILYEKSSVNSQKTTDLKSYIRGYLMFNYFINSFIILHFKGFDTFIEVNEPDFIIYLNLFEFYNSSNTVVDDSHYIPLDVLRRLVLAYLVKRKLLSFDVEELYGWLYKYIDYLREKDLLEQKEANGHEDGHRNQYESNQYESDSSASELSDNDSTESAPPTPPSHNSRVTHAKAFSMGTNETGNTLDSFENRYPEMQVETPKPPKTKIPPLPPVASLVRAETMPVERISESTNGRIHYKERAKLERIRDLPERATFQDSSSELQERTWDVPERSRDFQRAYDKASLTYERTPYGTSSLDRYSLGSISPSRTSLTSVSPSRLSGSTSPERLSTDRLSRVHKVPPPLSTAPPLRTQSEAVIHKKRPPIPLPLPSSDFPLDARRNRHSTFFEDSPRDQVDVTKNRHSLHYQDYQQQQSYQQMEKHRKEQEAHGGYSQYPSFPPQGYPPQAFPPQAYPPQAYPPQAFPPQAYSPQAFPPQAYPPNAYPPQGQVPLPPQNYPTYGQHQNGRSSFSQRSYMMKELGICGLKNFGSLCYINLTIQVLFSTSAFIKLFSNLEYHKYVKDPRFVKVLRIQKESANSKDSFLISEAISGLLRTFKQFGGSSISPSKFIRVSAALKPELNIPNEQQDAQEFLLFVLDRLHEELSNKALIESGIIDLDFYISKFTANLGNTDPKYAEWYKSLLKYEGSLPINDMYQGHLQNKLICTTCGFESMNYSSFSILSLPIPSNGTSVVNLSDCIGYYTQDELLSGDNAWNCPKCTKAVDTNVLDSHPVFTPRKSGIFRLGGKRNKSPVKLASKVALTTTSIKRLNFIKLPQVLFIHLSRFSNSLTQKLDVTIQYPLELKFEEGGRGGIIYKLLGIINHYGNLKSGHYTALVDKSKSNDGPEKPYWCLFDDESVGTDLSNKSYEIQSKEVYVLSYERVG